MASGNEAPSAKLPVGDKCNMWLEHAEAVQAADKATDSPYVPQRLFVGGLPSNSTEELLREVFAVYGTVREVNIVRDRGLDMPKGCVSHQCS